MTIDLGTLERPPVDGHPANGGGGAAVATRQYAPPAALVGEVSFADAALFEIRVLTDDGRGAAAIELVGRSNKDRPDARRAFAVKCASYLQAGVSVVFVDPVAARRSDLHTELVRLPDLPESLHWSSSARVAAVSYRVASAGETGRVEVWPEDLVVGSPLPTVPLWLATDLAVPVGLETTYEAAWACHRR